MDLKALSPEVRETVASERGGQHEERNKVDQHVQTDLSWSETGVSAVEVCHS